MRRTAFACGLAVLATVGLSGCSRTTVDDDVLRFQLPDLDGNVVSLEDERFAGKVVLVDLWGTWCPPCIEQLPHLIAWQKEYRDEGFEIVAIDFATFIPGTEEEYREAMKEYASEKGINYTVLLGGETGEVEKVLPMLKGFKGFPTVLFIGRDGKVRGAKWGFLESETGYYGDTIEGLLREGSD